MPSIELYQMPESAPCRFVEMVAALANVSINKHPINLFAGEHLKEDFTKLNPQHKVPFIVDGEHKMGESRAIACYLVNRYMPEDNTLYPRDPVKRAQVDELLYFDATSLFPAIGKLFFPRILLKVKDLNKTDEQALLKVIEGLNQRASKLWGNQFFLGTDLTLGDVAVVTSFSLIEANDYDISKYNPLNTYLERVKSSVPNYKEINDMPIESLRQTFRAKLAEA